MVSYSTTNCATGSETSTSAAPFTLNTCSATTSSSNGPTFYTRYTCVNRSFTPPSPASAVIMIATPGSACPATGPPTDVYTYATGTCIPSQNGKLACVNASYATITTYTGAGCTGASTTVDSKSQGLTFGCVASSGYVQTITCSAPFGKASGARAGAGVAAAAGAAAGAALLALAARA